LDLSPSFEDKMKYLYKKITSECPLCSNKDNLLLYKINSELAARYLTSKKDMKNFLKLKKLIETLWKKDECNKILCKNCLLFYTDPFVAGTSQFYSQIYSSSEKYPSWRWDYTKTLKALEKICVGKKNFLLLEIGAGIGEFLIKIPEKILPRKNIFSCEISQIGKKALKEKGVTNYEDFIKVKKKFDILCIFETIEHLDMLSKMFKKIEKTLSKDGHLFLSTTTQKTIRFFEQKGSGLDLPPTHLTCWNKKSFEIFAKKYGFKIIERKLKTLGFFRKNLNFGLGIFENKKLNGNSLENKIDNISNRKLRKAFIFAYLFIGSPYFLLNTLGRKLYASQWIHLQKV